MRIYKIIGYTKIADPSVCDNRAVALKEQFGLRGFSHHAVESIWRDYSRKYREVEWAQPDRFAVEDAFGVILTPEDV